MIVVGIDPSLTSAGVAHLLTGQPHIWHHGFSYKGHKSDKLRSRRVRYQTNQIVTRTIHFGTPDLILIERPLTIATRGSADVFDRYELAQRLYGIFDQREIPCAYVNNQTAKAWITGKGGSKADVQPTVQAWYPDLDITCDDEADALGFAAMAAFHLGDPLPFPTKQRHNLASVAWPERM